MRTLVATCLIAAAARSAATAPEEIQVYQDELNQPGQVGLDVHNNVVVTGDDPGPAYAGEQASLHRLRVTPEFALGLTRALELGLYLPLATLDRDGDLGVDGVKARLKFIAPRAPAQRWYWGANFEIGVVDHELDPNPYNAEAKGIAGARLGRWILGCNLNLDFTVYGHAAADTTLEVGTKLAYAVTPTVAVGVESFNGLGAVDELGHLADNEHASYATIDATLGGWDLDLGVGSGYGGNTDGMMVKAIVGVPID